MTARDQRGEGQDHCGTGRCNGPGDPGQSAREGSRTRRDGRSRTRRASVIYLAQQGAGGEPPRVMHQNGTPGFGGWVPVEMARAGVRRI